jgi:hypothetical protein
MAYNSGNILHADPAAQLIAAIEDTMDDHTGQWTFVETVPIASIDYKIWKNSGTSGTNPNSFGSDFYLSLNRVTATQIRIKVFEHWDATNKKIIRPVQGKSSLALNANGSYGDETNGYTADNIANLTYAGWTSLATTGFDYFIQATKDQLRIAIKQAALDDFISLGVFETLLVSTPAETFPLYLTNPQASSIGDDSFIGTTVLYALSRHPGNGSTTQTENLKGSGQFNVLGPTLIGGIDAPTAVDKLHNNAWITGRPTVQHFGGQVQAVPQTYGRYRGLIYDALLLADNGAAVRNGSEQTLGSDVYVKFWAGTTVGNVWWIKRDAV